MEKKLSNPTPAGCCQQNRRYHNDHRTILYHSRTVGALRGELFMKRAPVLTDPIRAYLRRAETTALLYDVVQDLIKSFQLTPEQAGRVIVEWINETT